MSEAAVTLESLTLESFVDIVGSAIEVISESGAVAGTLTLVSATPTGFSGLPGRTPFSLIFSGAPDWLLAQGTISAQIPQLGLLDIFIVPISGNDQERRYQAIFS